MRREEKTTQGWVVYGGMRHAEPQREMFSRSYGNEVACAWLRGVRGPCMWRYDGTQSGGGHVGEHDPADWYILWLKMLVRVVDDSVHVWKRDSTVPYISAQTCTYLFPLAE